MFIFLYSEYIEKPYLQYFGRFLKCVVIKQKINLEIHSILKMLKKERKNSIFKQLNAVGCPVATAETVFFFI
jgi:hypothetical protein